MLTLNTSTQAVDVDGAPVELTSSQFAMLLLLVREGRASRRQLCSAHRPLGPRMGNDDWHVRGRARNAVKHIRRRIKVASPAFDSIKMISGFGYRWEGDARIVSDAPSSGCEVTDARVGAVIGRLGRGRIWRMISAPELKQLLAELLDRRRAARSAATGAGATSCSGAAATPAGAQGDPSGSHSPRISSLPPTSGASAVTRFLGS